VQSVPQLRTVVVQLGAPPSPPPYVELSILSEPQGQIGFTAGIVVGIIVGGALLYLLYRQRKRNKEAGSLRTVQPIIKEAGGSIAGAPLAALMPPGRVLPSGERVPAPAANEPKGDDGMM